MDGFIRGLLDDQSDPQVAQYNPQAGWDTAKDWAKTLYGMTTPGGVQDAAGLLGGPSIRENVGSGNYGDAAMQALGVLPGVGVAKGLLGAKLAMAAAPAAKIARSPRKLTEAAKAAEGGEDLFDFSRLSEVPKVDQTDIQRYVPPRGGTARVNDLVANPDVKDKMLGIIERGREMGGPNWYNADPLRDRFIQELGSSAGGDAFNKYMDLVAATSPRSDVGTNARNASYYYQRLMSGQDLPEVGTRNPAPYGHLAQKNHQQNAIAVAGDGWDPIQNPKPASFAQNLMGNQAPVTVDTHAFRAPAIFSADPRFLATSYKPSKDVAPINFQKLLSSGEKTMDELVNTPVAWDAMPKKTEYGAMENYYKDLAKEVGMTPAQTQASAWVGGSGHTGLMSDESKPFLRFLQDRVHLTAQKTGMDPQDVLSQFIKGKMPLLSMGGAGLLGAASLPSEQSSAPTM